MTTTTTSTDYSAYVDSAASVSWLNLLGIGVSVVFTLVYLVLGAHAMKYLKSFACKIKIIVNRAEDKELKAKDYQRKGDAVKKRSQNYYRMEDALKNEVRKSKSPYFMNIFACYMAKYDHLVYYPFRTRMLDKIELLRPKPSFHAMLDVASICISWTSTILLVSLIQQLYTDITTVSFTIYALFTAAISLVTSILSILAINRFYRLYELNIKNAFKVDYGNQFVKIQDGGLDEYNPENSQELEDIKIYQQITKGRRIVKGVNSSKQNQSKEDTLSILNSTRKLLGDEMANSEPRKQGKQASDKTVIQEEDNEEDEEYNAKATTDNQNHSLLASKIQSYMQNQKNTGRTIQDLFGMHKHVEGFETVNPDQKILFIEDKHHIGDLDLLNNEANKGENSSNVITFTVMFLVICISAVVCCYLNYTFTSILSKNVFYMFLIAFVGDLLGFRVVLLFLYSLFKFLIYCCMGYKRLKPKKLNVKNELSKAIRDMYTSKKNVNKKQEKEKGKNETEDLDEYLNNMFANDRNDTSLKHFAPNYEENKEDDYAHEIGDNFQTKRDDDQDGEKMVAGKQFLNTKRPFDLENKSFEKTQQSAYHTQIPLMSTMQKQLAEKQEEEKEEQFVKEQSNIVNELADYNLLLFRKVFDAYDDKGERVLRQFRNDKNNVLRKRYVQSVVNPNYDYDKLMKELEKNKLEKEEVQEDPVYLDGEEVQEDEDQQEIKGEEMEIESKMEDESERKVDRALINRFGKKIDEEEKEIKVVLPMPERGVINQECEENIEEEDADEWSKLMKELAQLRSKKKSSDGLTEQEEKRLIYLEQLLDKHRHKEIEELEKMVGKRSNEEENSLKKLLKEEEEYRSKRIEDLFEQEMSSQGLDEEEKRELKELLEWQIMKKRRLLEELRHKKLMNTITDEELRILNELEEWDWQQKMKELEMLREKLNSGIELSESEKRRLKELEEEEINRKWKELEELRKKHKNGTLTDEERRRLEELEQWAKIMVQKELDELREKFKNGTLTEEEILRLQQLGDEELWRMQQELEMLREKERRGLLTEEEKQRLAFLEEWDRKRKLKELENNERHRLKEIEEMLKNFRNKGDENLTDLERLQKLQLEKERYEILCKQLRRIEKDHMTDENIKQINEYEDEIDRLEYEILLLKQKLGLLNEDELQKLRELETKFKMNEMSEIDKHEEEGEEIHGQVQDENDNPFEEQNMLNEKHRLYTEEQQKALEESQNEDEEEEEEVHDRLTDDEMFADLPAIEVMNKVPEDSEANKSRAQTQLKSNRSLKQEEVDEHGRSKSQQQQRNKLEQSEQSNKSQVDLNHEDKQSINFQDREELLQSEQDRRDTLTPMSQNKDEMFTPKSALKSIHENERLNTAKSNVRFKDQEEQEKEAEKLLQKQREEDELKNYQEKHHQQELNDQEVEYNQSHHKQQQDDDQEIRQQEERDKEHNEQLQSEHDEALSQQENDEKHKQRLKDEEHQKQKQEDDHKKQQEHAHNKQREEEGLNRQNEENIQKQREEEEINRQKAQSQHDQSNLSAQSQMRAQDKSLSEQQQDMLSQQKSNKHHQQFNNDEEELEGIDHISDKEESLMNFSAQDAMDGEGHGIYPDEDDTHQNKSQSRLQSAKSKQMHDQELSQKSRLNSAQSQRQKLDSMHEQRPATGISSKSKSQRMQESQDQSERQKSRMSSRQQDQNNNVLSQPREEDEDEDYDRNNMMSREQPSDIDKDQMLDFGHDDLEMGGAPGGPQLEPEESIYSHQTSTILDEEKVSFMHIEHLPNQDNASDDSFSEQDMVYYNKDDLTNYSKGLGLNKVQAKKQTGPQSQSQGGNKRNQRPNQQYYSENDIQEMHNEDGEISDSGESAYSLDAEGRRVRTRPRRGRGQIRHNDLEVQSYDDQIDGRVKVDAWNLNYNGKKKKLKKKKIDQNTKNKMNDLQNIYGVDARTLAGLQKGQGPKKGAGKDGDDLGRSRYNTDMSFRSTQNTFMKQSNNGGLGNTNQHTSKKSINDGASNMFSFNGGKSVISKRWNDIESTLKGGKVNQNTANKHDVQRRLPMNQMKKMTATQENFKKQPGYLEEETKSNRGSSNGSFSRAGGFQSSIKKGAKAKPKAQKKGYDSYSESDEGVNDTNAMFQSRDPELQNELFGNKNKIKKQQKQSSNKKRNNQFVSGGMNDDLLENHSESDEGVNQGNPKFDGNDQLVFKKRGLGESSKLKQSTQQSHKKSNAQKGSEIGIEDLEAQDMDTNKKNRRGISNKKQNNYKSSDDEGNLFGLQQQRQNRQSSNDQYAYGNQRMHSEASDMEQQNRGGQDGKFNASNSKNKQASDPKPPLSNAKPRGGNRNMNQDDTDGGEMRFNNANQRPRYPGGHTDTSDNERQSRNRMGSKVDGKKRRHRSNEGINDDEDDDADSYLVGPQSNHSMIRTREMGGRNPRNQDDRYMLLQRDTEMVEDIEANRGDNQFAKKRKVKRAAQSNNFRDANSQKAEQQRNERLKRKQIEEEKMLVQRHRDEEGGSVKGRNMSKMRKKKEHKSQVRKEVNYWLDYDSPYAEYLVARFREWSPNVGGNQAPQSRASNSRQGQNKYNEVSNLYGKNNNNQSRTHYDGERNVQSKQNSKSPDRGHHQPEQIQRSQRKTSDQKVKSKSDNEMVFNKPFGSKQVNNLFAEDFEEP